MARTRVFISSTYYDLKYVRASLDQFIEALGYDSVLSEKGAIAYAHDAPLDESCYREVASADIFVLIVGGRYGSEASEHRTGLTKTFYERYDSITKQEYKAAAEKDIPVYVLIEKAVYSEYQTFTKNRDRTDIAYAHVDSVNVFHLIEEILAQPRNNPIQTFERFADIESWLREQWSGVFRELLNRTSSQRQLTSLAAQVTELAAVNETLRRYLEEVISRVSPSDAANIIKTETARLEDARSALEISSNPLVWAVHRNTGIAFEQLGDLIRHAKSTDEFVDQLEAKSVSENIEWLRTLRTALAQNKRVIGDLNQVRDAFKLPLFPEPMGQAASVQPKPVPGTAPKSKRRR